MTDRQETESGSVEGVTEVSAVVRALDAISSSNFRVAALQLVAGLVAYAVVLGGPLFFDDLQFIVWNQHVTNFDLAEIYSSSVTEGVGIQSNTYRPNQQFVFAVLYKAFGVSPVPYHLVSLSVHVINAFLVFLLLVALSLGRNGSLLGSLLFLLHPVQTQAVSYASGLAGPLLLLSLLGAVLCWIKSVEATSTSQRTGWFLLALVLCIDAAFTKSNVVIIAPLALVVASYFVLTGRQRSSPYLIGSVAAFAVFAIGFMFVKLTLLNFAGTTGMVEGYSVYTDNLHVRLMSFVSVLDRYVGLIVWPSELSYSKPKIIYTTLLTNHGILGLLVVAAGGLALLRAKSRPAVFIGCGWFFAALAPFSGVIPLPSMYLEHWLYAPMVGVAILLAGLYRWVDRRWADQRGADGNVRRNVAVVCLAILAALLLRTAVRNYDWADPERFYIADMRVAGVSTQMLNNLAIHLMSIDENERAIKALETIINASDTAPEPHDNLARIYVKRGEKQNAKRHFLRALEIDPFNRNALMGIRALYDSLGEIGEAMKVEQRIRAIERQENLSLE